MTSMIAAINAVCLPNHAETLLSTRLSLLGEMDVFCHIFKKTCDDTGGYFVLTTNILLLTAFLKGVLFHHASSGSQRIAISGSPRFDS